MCAVHQDSVSSITEHDKSDFPVSVCVAEILDVRASAVHAGLDTHVEYLLKTCDVFLPTEKSTKVVDTPLEPVEFPVLPWQNIAMDIVEPCDRAPAVSFCDHSLIFIVDGMDWIRFEYDGCFYYHISFRSFCPRRLPGSH